MPEGGDQVPSGNLATTTPLPPEPEKPKPVLVRAYEQLHHV